jgi:hypothetical protein
LLARLLYALRVSSRLRAIGVPVLWTLEEIERAWFGSVRLNWERVAVEAAFNQATRMRGYAWVVGPKRDLTPFAAFPGIGPHGGYQEFLRVYWFGKRMASIVGTKGSDDLIRHVIDGDPDADEEATAIDLLRSSHPETKLEVEPLVKVGTRDRKPDFRIKKGDQPWVYCEVTRLHSSAASVRVHQLLARLGQAVMTVDQPFLLEVLLNREPTDSEEEVLLSEARKACVGSAGVSVDVGDFATVLVKAGTASVVVPSIIPNDRRPRMALSQAVVGPGQSNRQIVLRIPFADERAEDILAREARQLPKDECGLLMVNVNSQPGAFESWGERVPQRFTPRQHTRVAGVILFMHATYPTEQGLIWSPFVKLIANPHAVVQLPAWITSTIDEIRNKTHRVTGRPD